MDEKQKRLNLNHITRRDLFLYTAGIITGVAAAELEKLIGIKTSPLPIESSSTSSTTVLPTKIEATGAAISALPVQTDLPKPTAADTATATPSKETSDLMLCVDTMKESRDRAQSLTKYEDILPIVKEVAKTGATHIAIGTPYDKYFGPLMHTWVKASRDSNLKVFFRGNFCESGKDKDWFLGFPHDPAKTPEQHLASMKKFITDPQNKDLFQPGDILSIPEPEESNRMFPDVYGADKERFLKFNYESAINMRQNLDSIGATTTKIAISHNADIAKIIPDEVNIAVGSIDLDHYSEKDPKEMADRIQSFKNDHPDTDIWITETGAGRADRQGAMNPEQQAEYLDLTMKAIRLQEITKVNYWVLLEGDTLLVDGPVSGPYNERSAYQVLSKHYHEMRGLT